MPSRRVSLAAAISTCSTALAFACGPGRPHFDTADGSGGSKVSIHLSAGAPIQGATVSVYAINDGDGRVNTLVGNAGVIGIGGPTDAAGNASVALSMPHYSGPIQVTASGAS